MLKFLRNLYYRLEHFYDALTATRLWKIVYDFGLRMSNHKSFIMAGGIAFNVILYIIPLILIAIYFVTIFVPQETLVNSIITILGEYLPSGALYGDIIGQVIDEVQNIANRSRISGIAGFVVLLWISSTIISTLNTCITTAFDIEPPDYIRTKLKDLGITIFINILIILYCMLPAVNVATSFIDAILPHYLSAYVSKAVIFAVQMIIPFLFFYFIYWIIPSRKDKNASAHHWIAMRATLIAVLATGIARFAFGWYISTIANYSRFYGTYALIVTLAVWLYYSCFIILFSAELSKFIYDRRQMKFAKDNQALIADRMIRK